MTSVSRLVKSIAPNYTDPTWDAGAQDNGPIMNVIASYTRGVPWALDICAAATDQVDEDKEHDGGIEGDGEINIAKAKWQHN